MVASAPSSAPSSPGPARSLWVAIGALVGLIVVSLALPWVADAGLSRGLGWTAAKVAVLVFVFTRVRKRDVYAMQWSSMLVLLFVAEGVVRAMTDPAPTASLGALAAVCATVYFVAVLAYLRPLKRAARAATGSR